MLFREFFLTLTLVISVISSPLNLNNPLEDLDDENYDIVIDQRQNGTQNFRIRISGLNIALPAEEEEPQPPNSQLSNGDLSSLLFSALSSPATSSQTSSSSSATNDFAELASLFDWKKKANKKSTDTQSRTKDLPTESQLTNDAKLAVRNYVKGNGRKYKLLVGEKYLIPIIQFLKQQAESSD